MTSIIFATTVLLLCSVVAHVLAVNRAFREQHCVHKATRRIRVSFLVFVFSNVFHINSFCSQNVTEQFTVINLWPLLHVLPPSFKWNNAWIGVYSIWIQPPGIFFLYLLIYLLLWKLHPRFKFVRTKRSGNKLGLSIGLLESSTENSLNWETKQSSRGSPRIEELRPLVEASKLTFYLNQS